MNKQTKKIEQFEVEKAYRFEVAKANLLDGTIGAISVDTCIFTANDYRLDKGVLKHLEQFKNNAFELVFSEITIKEIENHITKHSEEAKIKLRSALRDISKYWQEQAGKEAATIDSILGSDTVKELANKKLKDFVNSCGASLIAAKSMLDIDELLKMYFDLQPPFESSKEKKSEFPDAIALLTLQVWAMKNGKSILFVTKDEGCKRFCDGSKHLYAIDSLFDALSLIQQRDAHLSTLCKTLEKAINGGKYPDLIDRIEATIADDIYSIDWIPEADASYYYESELENVKLISAIFNGAHEQPEFSIVDYNIDILVVHVSMLIEVDATCSFTFSIKDGFDHDMVDIGNSLVSTKMSVKVDVLLTFENPNIVDPEINEIELVYGRRTINFGGVEPDFGDDDPNSEYY